MRSEFLVSSTCNVLHRLTINKVLTIFINFQVFPTRTPAILSTADIYTLKEVLLLQITQFYSRVV